MEKNVYLVLDEKFLVKFLVKKETTVKMLLEAGNDFLKSKNINPDNYSISFRVDKKNEVKSILDPKYENICPYNQIKEGYLIYTSDIFSSLSKDTLAALFATMRSLDINNLCMTSKKMMKVCSKEDFWKKVNIYKFGTEISLGLYPTWKSRFLDSDESSKIFKPIFGVKGIYMSPYTPYRKFILDVSSSFKKENLKIYFEKNINYDYKNLDSFPISLKLIPFFYQPFNNLMPQLYPTGDTLDHFNHQERYLLDEKGKLKTLEKGKYYYKFIMTRPYFHTQKVKEEYEILEYGNLMLAFEFSLKNKGWWREIVPLPYTSRSFPNRIFEDKEYEAFSKYF